MRATKPLCDPHHFLGKALFCFLFPQKCHPVVWTVIHKKGGSRALGSLARIPVISIESPGATHQNVRHELGIGTGAEEGVRRMRCLKGRW